MYSRGLREPLISLRHPETPDGDDDTNYRRSADWNAIVELSSNALVEQTKDIRIVCHLIEAWTQIRQFEGLYDGLVLLTEFVDSCWERSNPSIDDGDLEARTAPIENMLDDPNRGICFPTTIRQIPLIGDKENTCNFTQYQSFQQNEPNGATLNQLVSETKPDWFQKQANDLELALAQLDVLKTAFHGKLGSLAPGMTYLRAALEDCQRVIRIYYSQIMPETQSQVVDQESAGTCGQNHDATVSDTKTYRLGTRDDAYQMMTQAAEFLRKTEPHSPIPYLVFRAVELGKMPFPKLVQQLIREDGILNEIRREFGIHEVVEETARDEQVS